MTEHETALRHVNRFVTGGMALLRNQQGGKELLQHFMVDFRPGVGRCECFRFEFVAATRAGPEIEKQPLLWKELRTLGSIQQDAAFLAGRLLGGITRRSHYRHGRLLGLFSATFRPAVSLSIEARACVIDADQSALLTHLARTGGHGAS
jgi:hypothetical protein